MKNTFQLCNTISSGTEGWKQTGCDTEQQYDKTLTLTTLNSQVFWLEDIAATINIFIFTSLFVSGIQQCEQQAVRLESIPVNNTR